MERIRDADAAGAAQQKPMHDSARDARLPFNFAGLSKFTTRPLPSDSQSNLLIRPSARI